MEQTLLFEPIEPKNNKVQVFNSPQFGEIRITVIDGEPWFVGKDVAERLGYTDTAQAIRQHIDEEDKGVVKITTPGGNQNVTIINESGLYSLVLRSNLPTAKQFKRWVTSEVLPSIRKNGVYATDITVERAVEDPDFLIGILTQLKEEKSKRKEIEEQKRRQEERNKYLTSENARLERKGKWVDHQTGQDETLYTFEAAAKTLGVRSGKKLILFLTDHEFIFRRYDSKHKVYDYYAHAAYAEKGLFRIVYDTPTHRDGTPIVNPQTNTTISTKRYFRITELGLAFIQMKLEEAGLTKKVIGTKEKYEKLKEEYENKE